MFVYIFWPCVKGLQDLLLDQRLNPNPQQWKGRVLITGLPGNSQSARLFSILPCASPYTKGEQDWHDFAFTDFTTYIY